MANIRVDVGYTIKDGAEIKFRSPVDCSAVTGLIVYYPGENGDTTSNVFAFADAHGNNVGVIPHLFSENVVVKVILDITTCMAFVQNADTNAYIERTFIKSVNGVTPDDNGNVVVEVDALSGTDASLTEKGKAADAAAVGNALKEKAAASAVSNLAADLEVERARITNLATLPNGSTTGDAELADIRVGLFGESYGNAGDAVRGQVGYAVNDSTSLAEDTKENAQLLRVSNGHFFKIHTDRVHQVGKLFQSGSTVVVDGTVAGSDYIKCPKYVCVYFPDAAARCRLYFYKLDGGAYVPRWDIIDTTGSASSGYPKNYLSRSYDSSGTHLLEMPDDNVYLTFQSTTGCELYGWDGEMFGMPMSADCVIPTTSSGPLEMHENGSYGVTIPGSARFIVSKTKLAIVNAYRGEEEVNLFAENRQFFKLPEGYDFFRVRVLESKITKSGDISDILSAVVDTQSEKASGRAAKIIENCKKVCSLQWTPVNDLNVSTEVRGQTYKKGVTYNGIPYGSNWQKAHFVGWHVSPHTFVNAVNDSESIFYNETVESDSGVEAPYYSIVCSAFATMCAGWPYPTTNRGLLYDPKVELTFCNKPPIGQVYSNKALGHCVITERIDHLSDGVAVSVYESILPTTVRTTRYEKVTTTHLGNYFRLSAGLSRYNDYGYMAHHIEAVYDMSIVPYLGMTEEDLTIVNGSARPYKGDKSVYTSAEDSVKINIKDTSATILFLEKDGEDAQSIAINGATQMDVKSYLNGDGIYYVYTDADATQESFEYVVVEPVTFRIDNNGVPVVDSKDFWYALFVLRGDPRAGGKAGSVAQPPADDYSYLVKDGKTCSSVSAMFRKGTYGAYAVPRIKES